MPSHQLSIAPPSRALCWLVSLAIHAVAIATIIILAKEGIL